MIYYKTLKAIRGITWRDYKELELWEVETAMVEIDVEYQERKRVSEQTPNDGEDTVAFAYRKRLEAFTKAAKVAEVPIIELLRKDTPSIVQYLRIATGVEYPESDVAARVRELIGNG